jgi:HTH-type transcriptional regulator / antitoxin HigA
MKIKPLRNEAEYEAALKAIESLMDTEPGTEQYDDLELLSLVVADYEQKQHPVAPPDPIVAIQYYVESRGLSRKDLEEILNCSSGRVSELLNRKRTLTLGMIRKLHEHFGISTDILIRDYALVEDEIPECVIVTL